MSITKMKNISIVGDKLHDAESIDCVCKALLQMNINYLFYKDAKDVVNVTSVILILDEKSDFEFDANSFVENIIDKQIPLIVVYAGIKERSFIHDTFSFSQNVLKLWHVLPAFAKERFKVPTIHISLNDIQEVVKSNDFRSGTHLEPSDYYILAKK